MTRVIPLMQRMLARIGLVLSALLLASAVVFGLSVALSGDASTFQAGVNAGAGHEESLRQAYGLDQPLPVRYGRWLLQLVQFDLGVSLTWGVPVSELVYQRAGVTLALTSLTCLFLALLAVPLSLILAPRIAGLSGAVLTTLVQIFSAIPPFILGFFLLTVFAVQWELLPAGGTTGSGDPAALLLPLLALLLPQLAILVRFLLAALLENERKAFSLAARARGLSRTRNRIATDLRHALAPALGVFSLQFLYLISGTIIIESLFRLNGLGQLIVLLISRRDELAVASVTMLLILLTMLVQQLSLVAIHYITKSARFR